MSPDPSTDILKITSFYQATNYIAVSAVSLVTYDVLLGIFDDIQLLSIHSLKLPDIIYILSRLLAISEASVNCIAISLPPTSCHRQSFLLAGKFVLAVIIPCNSWLFFLRIRAIPEHFRPRGTLIICMILWLSTFTSFLVFPGYKFSSVETQDGRCEGETEYNSWFIFVPYLALVIFDTTTMMAILAGFAMHSPELSWFARVRSALSTKHMGHLSGVFVRSGLIYYLATIGMHVSIVVIIFTMSSDFSGPLVGQLNVLISIFHSIMTCRVYRVLKLGAFNDPPSSVSFPTTWSSTNEMVVFQNVSAVSS